MKILGHKWKFRVIEIPEAYIRSGEADYSKKVIGVDTLVTTNEQESTILHEIIEVINKGHGMRLKHQTICTLEISIYETLTENGVNLSPLRKDLINEMRILQKRNTATRKKVEGNAQD